MISPNYKSSQTLSVMDSILAQHLDAAERLAATIADLEADLRDAANDWRENTITVRLTAARDEQRRRISQAAMTLRQIEAWNTRHGLESHVLARVFEEYGK